MSLLQELSYWHPLPSDAIGLTADRSSCRPDRGTFRLPRHLVASVRKNLRSCLLHAHRRTQIAASAVEDPSNYELRLLLPALAPTAEPGLISAPGHPLGQHCTQKCLGAGSSNSPRSTLRNSRVPHPQ